MNGAVELLHDPALLSNYQAVLRRYPFGIRSRYSMRIPHIAPRKLTP